MLFGILDNIKLYNVNGSNAADYSKFFRCTKNLIISCIKTQNIYNIKVHFQLINVISPKLISSNRINNINKQNIVFQTFYAQDL